MLYTEFVVEAYHVRGAVGEELAILAPQEPRVLHAELRQDQLCQPKVHVTVCITRVHLRRREATPERERRESSLELAWCEQLLNSTTHIGEAGVVDWRRAVHRDIGPLVVLFGRHGAGKQPGQYGK